MHLLTFLLKEQSREGTQYLFGTNLYASSKLPNLVPRAFTLAWGWGLGWGGGAQSLGVTLT